ncbi:MAG: hypothetical protein ACK57T_13525, partial [Dolichospermum sp.]
LSKEKWTMELEQLFCAIDDFCLDFEAKLNSELIASQSRKRKSHLCLSEVMTIILLVMNLMLFGKQRNAIAKNMRC